MDEKILSTISTTEKDFNAIYPELLDTVKKLTNRWDPSQSNESDPLVVLIKELAIMGDKLNYNIDKNILENFPLSVTQLSNARKIYDVLGYNMRWYQSALGTVNFKLKDTIENLKISGTYFEVPIFTEITDSDKGSVLYTTLESARLSDVSVGKDVTCIQGKVHILTVNGNDYITLNDLDEDLRIYLPETTVAQNGIFVAKYIGENTFSGYSYTDSSSWRAVDNLLTYDAGQKIFEFGLTSDGSRAYIQFPQDVASIMKSEEASALQIRYTTTDGLSGNVKSLTLSTFVNEINAIGLDDSTISMSENIRIRQVSPITNGLDPETIDEAYKNYKKSVGRFNTLVTRRDYESFIYNDAKDSSNMPLVSNVVVADRTCDINYTNHITTWDLSGNSKELKVATDNNNPMLNAYDVVLYMTKPNPNIYSNDAYDVTYSPIRSNDDSSSVLQLVGSELDHIKSIQHDLRLPYPSDDNLFNIDNMVSIKGILYTYNKVTKDEAKTIQNNVTAALWKYCNNRVLNYGEELTYDKLIDIITSADSSIRTFALTSLDNNLSVINTNGSALNNASDILKYKNDMIARMILSGNVQLFNFDTNFAYDFGQLNGQVVENIEKITTEAIINVPGNEFPSEPNIKDNSIVQLYAPSLITTDEFSGYGIKVTYTFTASGDCVVYAGHTYRLKGTLRFDNLSGSVTSKEFVDPIVYFNTGKRFKSGEQISLSSYDIIDIKKINETTIEPGIKYYFILNSGTSTKSTLSLNAGESYVLQDNEYFWYASASDLTDIVYLGSGTKITNLGLTALDVSCDRIDSSKVGYTIDWKDISPSGKIKLTEMTIENVGSGYYCCIYGGSAKTLSNTPIELENTDQFMVKLDKSSAGKLLNPPIQSFGYDFWDKFDYKWYARSRLTISASPNVAQTLYEGQTISLSSTKLPTPVEIKSGSSIKFNYPLDLSGGENLDASILSEDGTVAYDLSAYYYTLDSDNIDKYTRSNDYIVVKVKDLISGSSEFKFTFNNVANIDESYIIPIYATINGSEEIAVTDNNNSALKLFNGTENGIISNISSNRKSYLYSVAAKSGNINSIKFTITSGSDSISDEDTIYIGYINKLNGLNADDINSDSYELNSSNRDTIVTKINSIDSDNSFDWTYRVPEDEKVVYPTEPSSYWNSNHIYNKYTISRINFKNSNIVVNPSSVR